MDRLNQLRGEAGGSRDSTLDTSSPPSEAFMTANESTSKYFSMSEVESPFDISPIKDVSLASAAVDTDRAATESEQLTDLSPINKKNDLLDSYKIGKQIEAANILSGGVDIFDDNDNSYDGNELIIDDNVEIDNKSNSELKIIESGQVKGDDENVGENVTAMVVATASNKSQAMLRIGDKIIEAIDIGNGLYMYRQEGQEELEAVQFSGSEVKFLKVRENGEGNLEIYEEIQVEVPKEVPNKEGKNTDKNKSHAASKVKSDTIDNPVAEKKNKSPENECTVSLSAELEAGPNNDTQPDTKFEVNVNGRMKFNEARKSPVIGSFTPMTYHSTPNKEGIPLTKTMVDLQLHPSRHSDNIKKTIEVHGDSSKQRSGDTLNKTIKDFNDEIKHPESNVKANEKILKGINESKMPVTQCLTKCIKDSEVSEAKNVPREQKAEKEAKGAIVEKQCVKENETILIGEVSGKSDKCQEKEELPIVDQPSQIIRTIDKDKKTTDNNDASKVDKQDTNSLKTSANNADSVIQPITSISVGTTSAKTQSNDEIRSKPNSTSKNSPNERIDRSIDVKKISVPNKEDKTEKILERQSAQPSTSIETLDKDAIIRTNATETTQSKIIQSQHQKTTEHENKEIAVGSKSLSSENNITKIKSISNPQPNPKEDIVKLKVSDKKSDFDSIGNKKAENTNIMKDSVKLLASKDEIKVDSCSDNIDRKIDTKHTETNKNVCEKLILDKKDNVKSGKTSLPKPINNNHTAVPFGKWTEANRQEFLNKIKESKVPTAASNGKQIKNSNDLNRRDVLKKIDSQRQTSIATAKALEIANSGKLSVKRETPIFASKSSVTVTSESQIAANADSSLKNNPVVDKKQIKEECTQKPALDSPTSTTSTNIAKKETTQRKEINNQDLIDKTIEDLINRPVPVKGSQEDANQNALKELKENSKTIPQDNKHHQSKTEQPSSLDEIEMQMNKLHGIPFVERPPHELPQLSSKHSFKTYSKAENEKAGVANRLTKVPNLLPFVNKNQQKNVKENIGDVDSDEEIIEHEPITGDIELDKKIASNKIVGEKMQISKPIIAQSVDASKKDAIITENDFDKFARRNSITYENCLKLNYDGNEKHNVIHTVVEKDNVKIINKDDILQVNIKSPQKQDICNIPSKVQTTAKIMTIGEEMPNKNYHSSKVKMAYQSVMTAKRQLERPITIIEDKPVKVLYVDSSIDYFPSNLNAQGKDLVPITKQTTDVETVAVSSCDSLDSDVIDSTEDNKLQEEAKSKSKHQRKQVLTPVDTPELELIEPEDLGFNVSPKKKRKTEDYKIEKNTKAVVPKKSYLLGRGTTSDDKLEKSYDLPRNSFKQTIHHEDSLPIHNDAAASAIDSLVKAAALIETQSENIKNVTEAKNSDSPPVTPMKRGRGRPRKYPLPDGDTNKNAVPSAQKKPRLIDAKVKKVDNDIEQDDSSGDDIVAENWTMGKINEDIVCPICSKLFRSENVVFKHVKHCTGPSPNRSDSDKRSPRRGRQSQESETRDKEPDVEENVEQAVAKKPKSKENPPKYSVAKNDIIVIEDTPIKDKYEKRDTKSNELKKIIKNKAPDKSNNLVCEFCGKIFRQLSYLVNHKQQHAKEDTKKADSETQNVSKSVFSCEVCKKEFRKLHHLVQHRIIHNPSNMSARLLRKSSSEQRDNKTEKDQNSKPNDDPSAGFRCEPCDKSFRKLHHLVEHRETHDGINRQKNTSSIQINNEKPLQQVQPPPQCDVCKKSFRKLHHLIEHKEQHLETSSEKSDDKSVKSSLSTKDIIHECSLCYMVFPNEHSLTKHATICQRKKRQSTTKTIKPTEMEETDENVEVRKLDETKKLDQNIEAELVREESNNAKPEPTLEVQSLAPEVVNASEENSQIPQVIENPLPIVPEKEASLVNTEVQVEPAVDKNVPKTPEDSCKAKIKKTDEKEIVKMSKTPKKKIFKEKIAPTVTKRQKTVHKPDPVVDEDVKPGVESSDDDEVRYMLNPDFKIDDSSEGKLFMKVRAKKRNSLQIDRPSSKDLVKRRISLQHPPKIPRLKPKPVESKVVSTSTSSTKNAPKARDLDPVPSTDSDDNDIKYSFPKTTPSKTLKSTPRKASPKDEKKTQRKSLAEKRKSLGGIAKRKSIGKLVAKHKVKPSPMKPIKKRTAEVDHRCDCGQLFSSAALLARHTTLAHTPPRIRRRRSPPPEIDSKTVTKPAPRKSTETGKSRPSADSRKSSVKSDVSNSKPGKETKLPARKSSVNKSDVKTSNDTRKSLKSSEESVNKRAPTAKARRNVAHRGVPVPQKMRKLMEKIKK